MKENSVFLKACRREKVEYTPIWFMRQAGRYMPEYRKIREKHPILEICKTPELACEVCLQPVKKLGVDAAILFSDIVIPLEGMGIKLELKDGVGPVIETSIKNMEDVKRLKVLEEEEIEFVGKAIQLINSELNGLPLIGFSGAPFTLASYILEGKPSRDFHQTRKFMYQQPEVWQALMERLTQTIIKYLLYQIKSGVKAVQLFDSWVGVLSPEDYQKYVLPYSQKIFSAVKKTGVPSIHFATGNSSLFKFLKKGGGDVISIDWRTPLDQAWDIIGNNVGIQGNLDPAVLFAPFSEIKQKAFKILGLADGRPGHIFNLGHGILPGTPVDNVIKLVDLVHKKSKR